MVVETLWPDNAPWWLNLFIWMATFWWYILVGFVPAFYIAVAKLFGMPLLQRWKNDVVIMLYPTKVKFRKINQQFEPYFRDGNGVYWFDVPLVPKAYETPYDELPEKVQLKLEQLREKYIQLSKKENKTNNEEQEMKLLTKQADKLLARGLKINPINQIHIYTHAVNQPIYNTQRRESKTTEIINSTPNPKKLPGHGIWILQNPRLHFHRHYKIIRELDGTYILKPVKDRQQFAIGFWHSLGIEMQKEVEIQKDMESGSGGGGKQLVSATITTEIILEQMKVIQDNPNFSASRAFAILKRRAKLEYGFNYWIQGSIDPRIFLLLGGLVAGVAMIFLFLHGGGTPNGTPAPTGPKMIL